MKTTKLSSFHEWTVILWLAAFAMAVFGFSGMAGTATGVVQILTLVFAILFFLCSTFFRSSS